jgi:hypothetical protein
MNTIDHHAEEWASQLTLLGRHGEGFLRLASPHGFVHVRRLLDTRGLVYAVEAGPAHGAGCFSAKLRGCTCDRPACSKAGRVRPAHPVRYDACDFARIGRDHPAGCGGYGFCHGGYAGTWVPADVTAFARRVLDTFAPARPAPRRKPQPHIRYDPNHVVDPQYILPST